MEFLNFGYNNNNKSITTPFMCFYTNIDYCANVITSGSECPPMKYMWGDETCHQISWLASNSYQDM